VLLNDVQLIVGETDPLIERLYAQLGSKMTPESGYFTQPPAFIGEARLSSVLVEAITKSPLLPRIPARQARAV
jgi:hypothetical protein